jgi:predicted RNA binding protein YcfA (HicA-like mRNA interferase family)
MKPLNARQVEAILRENGFWLVGSRGSHFKWRNAAGRATSVPHHGNMAIPQGTLLSIFRQAGITPPR